MHVMRRFLVLSLAVGSATLCASAFVYAQPSDRAGALRARMPVAPATAAPTAGALVPDQGVHNPLHAAHQNQIVFTRSDLTLSAISESALVSDFTLGQPIFFRVYTERSAVNAIALKNSVPAQQVYADGVTYTARFEVDGASYDTTIKPWGGRNDHLTWTTWRGQLGSPDRVVVPGADAFLELLSRATAAGGLKPGKHTITMELTPQTNTEGGGKLVAGPVARGTFTLTVPAGAFTPGNTAVCGAGRGAAGSAAMEARALAVTRQFWTNPDLTPVRAIAAGDSWKMELNPLTSVPIERSTRVDILSRGAKYCVRQVYQFTEKYMGGGNFSTATGGVSVNFEPGYVPCGCIG
jgi:hypothetical protein